MREETQGKDMKNLTLKEINRANDELCHWLNERDEFLQKAEILAYSIWMFYSQENLDQFISDVAWNYLECISSEMSFLAKKIAEAKFLTTGQSHLEWVEFEALFAIIADESHSVISKEIDMKDFNIKKIWKYRA